MIDVSDVAVDFGDLEVLDGVDLAVGKGELVGLVGPNGAGKTTLLRTVNGVLEPDAGTVRLDGTPMADLGRREVSRRVATVPQDTNLGFAFTAEQVVEMGRTPHRSRLDWAPDRAPVDAALKQTETDEFSDRPVDQLSGGERQRVLLARALAQDAPALVLDEPTASLDINHQVAVLDMVRDLVDEGRAAVAAIHDLDLAARYCDRLALLADGHIAASGPPAEVLGDPALEAAFGTASAVTENPVTGTPTVAAIGDRTEREVAVHLVGTGRAAARALGDLWAAGFDVSVGVVPAGDTLAAVAEDLDCPAVTTAPLSAPSDGERERARRLAEEADVCLRGPGAERLPTDPGSDPRGQVVNLAAPTEEPASSTAPPENGGPSRAVRTVLGALAEPDLAADDD